MSHVNENLPNVFVKDIVLSSVKPSDSSFKISVEVSVKHDIRSNEWLSDDFIKNNLEIVLIKSTNNRFNDLLTSGKIVFDQSTISQYSEVSGDIEIKQVTFIEKFKDAEQTLITKSMI